MSDKRFHARRYRHRLGVVLMVLGVVTMLLLGRLLYLQVFVAADYQILSDQNRFYTRMVLPVRGEIYDRYGRVLATNKVEYSLVAVPSLIPDLDARIKSVEHLIPISEIELGHFRDRLRRGVRPYTQVELVSRLSEREVAQFSEQKHLFPGLDIKSRLVRYYPYGEMTAHNIGYMSAPEDDQVYGEQQILYRQLNTVGKTGLELRYEDSLVGTPGSEVVEVNAHGQVMRRVNREAPTWGKNIHTTLDLDLIEVAHRKMQGKRGAVVAMDIATGELLLLYSSPGFDADTFTRGIGEEEYETLVNSPDSPLFNRALRSQYPPGSTIKPLVALAGLKAEVMNWQETVEDTGVFRLSDDEKRIFRGWERKGLGVVNLEKALYRSSNIYFWTHAERLGAEAVVEVLERFGFGKSLGLGSDAGNVPSPERKRAMGYGHWRTGDTLNLVVGQGDLLATPLHLAYMIAQIASDALVPMPSLVRSDRVTQVAQTHEQVDETQHPDTWFGYAYQDIAGIRRALQKVVSPSGTAARAGWGHSYSIAGKTGSSQVVTLEQTEANLAEEVDAEDIPWHLRPHALFVAYAPTQQSKLAVAVVVEHGGSGGRVASGIARDIIVAYLSKREKRLADSRKASGAP